MALATCRWQQLSLFPCNKLHMPKQQQNLQKLQPQLKLARRPKNWALMTTSSRSFCWPLPPKKLLTSTSPLSRRLMQLLGQKNIADAKWHNTGNGKRTSPSKLSCGKQPLMHCQKNSGQLRESLTMNHSHQIVKCGHSPRQSLAFKSSRRQLLLPNLPREAEDGDHAGQHTTTVTEIVAAFACQQDTCTAYPSWPEDPRCRTLA